MHSSPDGVCGESVTFSGSPSAPFVRSSGQILLPRYLMNGLSDLDETRTEYSSTASDAVIRFRGSNVKVTAGRRGDEGGIHVDASRSSSISYRKR